MFLIKKKKNHTHKNKDLQTTTVQEYQTAVYENFNSYCIKVSVMIWLPFDLDE